MTITTTTTAIWAAHRAKIFDALAALGVSRGSAYLRGDVTVCRHSTDVELTFRQESNFFYATGCDEPNYHLVLDISARRATLYAPHIDNDEAVWIGAAPSLATQATTFGMDVLPVAQMASHLAAAESVHVLEHETDANLAALTAALVDRADRTKLTDALTNARMYKTADEVALIKRANAISSAAHVAVMKATPTATSETELEALFRYECHRRGAPKQAYLPIVGVGHNAAILHYGRNTAALHAPDVSEHALVLVDAGCEVLNYASDITRTFPRTGKFTPEAKAIYETVLAAQDAVIAQLRAGVDWTAMHRLAERVIAQGLKDAGILRGSIDEILAHHAQAVFFPHGLGHLLGLDVHDVGGKPRGSAAIDEPSIRYLRLRRVLEAGMVVTVEPGVYFVDLLINEAKGTPAGQFIDFDAVARYTPVGGVRIE
ncbi:peptidase M24, structural domain-containing protein, partial [Blastocladiella britannica]